MNMRKSPCFANVTIPKSETRLIQPTQKAARLISVVCEVVRPSSKNLKGGFHINCPCMDVQAEGALVW